MGKHFKILGLSLLVLVGVMAVSASGAQAAKWLILSEGLSVTPLKVALETTEAGSLLVPGLGLNIHCTKGTGSVTASVTGGEEVLNGSGAVVFTGCKDVNFGASCEVGSKGKANETIEATGEGLGEMEGESVFVKLESKKGAPFTTVEYRGAECPLTEINGEVTGFVKARILEPLAELKLHVGHISSQKLEYGGEPATLEGDKSSEPLFSITNLTNPGGTFAIHLK